MSKSKTAKRLTSGLVTVIVLAFCLAVTTFALVYATVLVENNLFHTGQVALNLNDGKPVIEEHEFRFEPGMTVTKEFFVENRSTDNVYYRLYLDQIDGGLADVLAVTVRDGGRVLCRGTARELSRETAVAADDMLQIGERRTLSVTFYYPPEKGNETQGLDLTFTLCAEATQVKNNPERRFS